jgi:hypothetical protein
VVTRAGSGDGRHSRSKLREKEERRWDRESDRESASSKNGDKLVKVDDGAVTVDFKNAGKEVRGLGTKIKRAHKKAVKKLTKKVDAAVSGFANGGNKPATFRTARTSAQPTGYYGRSGVGYAAPPPWLGGLLGWGVLFAAAWAVTKVFGFGGREFVDRWRRVPFAFVRERRRQTQTPEGFRSGALGHRPLARRPRGVGRGQIRGGSRRARERARRGPGVRRPAPLGGCREGAREGRGAAEEGGGGGARGTRAGVVASAVAGVLPSGAARK